MKTNKFILLTFLFLSLFYIGCEQEDPIIPDPGPTVFTLKVTCPNLEAEFGEYVLITIKTNLADSVAYKIDDGLGKTIFIHKYRRPSDLVGEWVIVDTLTIANVGLNQAFVEAFDFLPKGGIEVKNDYISVTGYFPELYISAPSQVSWREGAEITITSKYGDYIVSNIPGFPEGMLNGTFITPPLDSTKTYYSELHSKRNNVTARSIDINVLPPTMKDYLCKTGPFGKIKIEFRDDLGAPWYEVSLGLCESDDRYVYEEIDSNIIKRTHYFGEIKCSSNEPDSLSGNYSLVWPILERDSGRKTYIEKLTIDTLIIQSPMLGETEYRVRETYIHP